jgi:hypothetical protein
MIKMAGVILSAVLALLSAVGIQEITTSQLDSRLCGLQEIRDTIAADSSLVDTRIPHYSGKFLSFLEENNLTFVDNEIGRDSLVVPFSVHYEGMFDEIRTDSLIARYTNMHNPANQLFTNRISDYLGSKGLAAIVAPQFEVQGRQHVYSQDRGLDFAVPASITGEFDLPTSDSTFDHYTLTLRGSENILDRVYDGNWDNPSFPFRHAWAAIKQMDGVFELITSEGDTIKNEVNFMTREYGVGYKSNNRGLGAFACATMMYGETGDLSLYLMITNNNLKGSPASGLYADPTYNLWIMPKSVELKYGNALSPDHNAPLNIFNIRSLGTTKGSCRACLGGFPPEAL